MHNLFEGTARHFMHVILENGILARSAMHTVEERTKGISSPYDFGRLPLKIASKFAGFKADQWRNWVIIFSEIALIGLIPQSYYNCWQKYAKACKLVCTHAITKMKITEADRLLFQEFCEEFCRLFGKEFCTLNMHKHLHFMECMLDYGPIYGFWCFPFERFNGQLGSFHTNSKNIELQIVRKFLRSQTVMSLPREEHEASSAYSQKSLQEICQMKYSQILHLQSALLPDQSLSFAIDYTEFDMKAIYDLSKSKEKDAVLSQDEQHRLAQVYNILHGDIAISFFFISN